MKSNTHRPVFAQEAVDALNVIAGRVYVDATYGEGGHAQIIASRGGTVVGLDIDPVQVAKTTDGETRVIHGSFAHIHTLIKQAGYHTISGILFDLGLSMDQLANGSKGLSYRMDLEALDMRFDSVQKKTAADVLNFYSHAQLEEILMKYSEDPQAAMIAKTICVERRKKYLETVADLKSCIMKSIRSFNQDGLQSLFARIFQAIRIEVNDELTTLEMGLTGANTLIEAGGRIVVISFHSLEDRIVKLFARAHASELAMKKIDVSKSRTLAVYERSATLRVLQKL